MAKRKSGDGNVVKIVGGVILVVVLVAGAYGAHVYTGLMRARAWTATGPACPTATRQTYLTYNFPAPHISDYEGVRYARIYGAINCATIADHAGFGPGETPICQFNNPSAVEVITQTSRTIFLTSNHEATITMDHGQPTCVLAAKMDDDPLRK